MSTGIDWLEIIDELNGSEIYEEDGQQMQSVFLGTVFALAPSGKYYMPWCSNFTEEEAEKDQEYFEALENEADENGLFIFSGEGDPCDIFVGRIVEDEDPVEYEY